MDGSFVDRYMWVLVCVLLCNDAATTEIYCLCLPVAVCVCVRVCVCVCGRVRV